MYNNASKSDSSIRAFMQERMLRLASEDDRLVRNDQIQWFSVKSLGKYLEGYNLYMTTDYTASNELKGDYSVVMLWAVTCNNDWFLIDMSIKKQTIDQQFITTINMAQKWMVKTGKHITMGVEIDGQQQVNIHSLKKLQQEKNVWFGFATQIGGTPGSWGISRRRAGGDKHAQFMRVHTLFQQGKIYLPEEFKGSPDMEELLHELTYITYLGISSKHDDALDGISMIALMVVSLPSIEAVGPVQIEGGGGQGPYDSEDIFEEGEEFKNSLIF